MIILVEELLLGTISVNFDANMKDLDEKGKVYLLWVQKLKITVYEIQKDS